MYTDEALLPYLQQIDAVEDSVDKVCCARVGPKHTTGGEGRAESAHPFFFLCVCVACVRAPPSHSANEEKAEAGGACAWAARNVHVRVRLSTSLLP